MDESRKQLKIALRNYMKVALHDDDDEWCEKMFAGVLAFIFVNYYKEPYLPHNFEIIEEKQKKWYEFWK